jgi:hypothetical protein
MTDIIKFPTKQKPWMTPQDDFEDAALEHISNSPNGEELCRLIRNSGSPFLRAAVIYCACSAEDVPFLLRIADALRD